MEKDKLEKFVMLMVIKEQILVQGSNEIIMDAKKMSERYNYFFNHLTNKTKTVEQLESEFGKVPYYNY
jgi:hypothetical protein